MRLPGSGCQLLIAAPGRWLHFCYDAWCNALQPTEQRGPDNRRREFGYSNTDARFGLDAIQVLFFPEIPYLILGIRDRVPEGAAYLVRSTETLDQVL
jgi:hypothetical protein